MLDVSLIYDISIRFNVQNNAWKPMLSYERHRFLSREEQEIQSRHFHAQVKFKNVNYSNLLRIKENYGLFL